MKRDGPNTPAIHAIIVEDDSNVAGSLKDEIKKHWPGAKVAIEEDFEGAEARLEEQSPDVVILDIFRGEPPDNDQAGAEVLNRLWEKAFVPIVVYTAAQADQVQHLPASHPFVKHVQKGAGSAQELIKKLKDFLPHIDALRDVKSEIGKATQFVLRDVSQVIWQTTADEKIQSCLLVRSARRRLGAMADLRTLLDKLPIYCWEQYIIPPLEADPLTGDLLRAVEKNRDEVDSYRVILTPSCDIVKQRGQPKSLSVLVARCKPITDYLKAAGLEASTGPFKMNRTLTRILTSAHCGGYVPFPEYPGTVPHMAANLRDLELLALSDIGNAGEEGLKFERVASVDSPFRESITWAYLEIAGRPGLPERNLPPWIESIIKCVKQNQSESGNKG